ncbi:MAG: hypothetical protein ACRDP4_01340 [Nocardioidaceae bacterium]
MAPLSTSGTSRVFIAAALAAAIAVATTQVRQTLLASVVRILGFQIMDRSRCSRLKLFECVCSRKEVVRIGALPPKERQRQTPIVVDAHNQTPTSQHSVRDPTLCIPLLAAQEVDRRWSRHQALPDESEVIAAVYAQLEADALTHGAHILRDADHTLNPGVDPERPPQGFGIVEVDHSPIRVVRIHDEAVIPDDTHHTSKDHSIRSRLYRATRIVVSRVGQEPDQIGMIFWPDRHHILTTAREHTIGVMDRLRVAMFGLVC